MTCCTAVLCINGIYELKQLTEMKNVTEFQGSLNQEGNLLVQDVRHVESPISNDDRTQAIKLFKCDLKKKASSLTNTLSTKGEFLLIISDMKTS